MPLPDALPPEIWSHMVSVASLEDSHLIPWLQVAPYTCAKGMHGVAFARLFRQLKIFISSDDHVLARLSRYSEEKRLYAAVRSLSVQWDLAYLENNPTSVLGLAEELLCAVLNKLERLQDIYWHNPSTTLWLTAYPIAKDAIYRCLCRHFASLTSMSLSGTNLHHTLDLRSATSLSKLHLHHVRVGSSSPSPPILLGSRLETLTLSGVESRDKCRTSILSAFDLSHIRTLQFSVHTGVSPLDLSCLSGAQRLTCLMLTQCGNSAITVLSKCTLQTLRKIKISLAPSEVFGETYAEKAVAELSLFVGRQRRLVDLEVDLAPNYAYREMWEAYDTALANDCFRDALMGLKELRRLSLAACTLTHHPAFDPRFGAVLPKLQTLIVKCVVKPTITVKIVEEFAQTINRYANLRGVSLQVPFAVRSIGTLFPMSLKKYAPRVTCCAIGWKYFCLVGGPEDIREVTGSDEDAWKVFKNLN